MKQQFFLLCLVLIFCSNCGIAKEGTDANSQASETSETLLSPTTSIQSTAADLLGTWDIKVQTPRGENASVLTIFEEDGQLKGKTDETTFNITREGNQLSWTSKLTTPRGAIDAAHKVLVEGKKLTGSLSAFGRTIELTGVKKE